MLKKFYKNLIAIALVAILLTAVLPISVFAIDVANGNVSVTASGSLTQDTSNGTLTATATTTSSTGCQGNVTYSNETNTVTITNKSSGQRVISFNYTLTLNGGSCTINNEAVSSSGSYSISLASKSSIQVSITSTSASENKTTIVFSNFTSILNATRTLTLNGATGGTVNYTYNGNAVSLSAGQSATATADYETGLAITATPSGGYSFQAWVNENNEIIATDASYTLRPSADMVIYPIFAASTEQLFKVGNKVFATLASAIDYTASSSDNTIIPMKDCTVPAGNYTIPSGVTLLVPFDDGGTYYTTTPEVILSYSTPSLYRRLTLADGANITVANGGQICVPSRLSAYQQFNGNNGTPTGKYGQIYMNEGSSITLQNNSGLYVYGFISGAGTVTAQSGSTVYECFQIKNWRGGTATKNVYNSTKMLIFNQYFVQNIEVPITINYGAKECIYSSVNASSSAYPMSAVFIGSNGLFKPSDSSSSITKRYDSATDRVIFDVSGNYELNSLTITGLPLIGSIDTSKYILPIANNFTINIHSGKITVNSDVAFITGSRVYVAKGAQAEIASGKSVYIYDSDEWDTYAGSNAKMYRIGYSAANGTTAKRTADDLVDVTFDVNGTMTVKGALYTTAGGADITSSTRSGKIVFSASAGTATTTEQIKDTDTIVKDIPITAAKLHNADGSYTATAGSVSGDVFTYSIRQNKWIKGIENYDVNEDGSEDINDVSFIMAASSETVTMTSSQMSKGDFNGDGIVDAFDASILEIYFCG